MKRQLITTFAVAVCCSLFSWAAALPIIPAPALVTEGEGYFEFDGSTKFAVENVEQLDVARLFTSRFGESAGFVPAIEIGGDGDVVFATDATLPAEGYKLDVSTGGISIKAADRYELNRKLVRFALGRGFDYALIRRCIDVPDDIDEGYGGEFVE